MSDFITKTANIGFLALAAIPLIAMTVAHAEPARIQVSDLDFSRSAQVATFDARVEHAADQICASYADRRDLDQVAACKAAVRAEAMDKLSAFRREAASDSIAVAAR